MKAALSLLAYLALAAAVHGETARDALRRGEELYQQQNFAAASEAFAKAAKQAGDEKLDPSVAVFDEANAQHKGGQFDKASELYANALKTMDLNLQASAYYNRGNSLMGLSAAMEQQQKLDEAVKSVDEAMAMYENAMTLSPKDMDAKINYELAMKKKEELKKEQQKQQQQNQDQQKDQKNKDQQKDQQNDQQKNSDQQKQEQNQKQQQDQDQQKQQEEQQKQEQKADQQPPENQRQPKEAQEPKNFEEMTPEEAKVILDSMKQDEQTRREQYRMMSGRPVPVEKDW